MRPLGCTHTFPIMVVFVVSEPRTSPSAKIVIDRNTKFPTDFDGAVLPKDPSTNVEFSFTKMSRTPCKVPLIVRVVKGERVILEGIVASEP